MIWLIFLFNTQIVETTIAYIVVQSTKMQSVFFSLNSSDVTRKRDSEALDGPFNTWAGKDLGTDVYWEVRGRVGAFD